MPINSLPEHERSSVPTNEEILHFGVARKLIQKGQGLPNLISAIQDKLKYAIDGYDYRNSRTGKKYWEAKAKALQTIENFNPHHGGRRKLRVARKEFRVPALDPKKIFYSPSPGKPTEIRELGEIVEAGEYSGYKFSVEDGLLFAVEDQNSPNHISNLSTHHGKTTLPLVRNAWDENGRLVKTEFPGDRGAINTGGVHNIYEYDEQGRITASLQKMLPKEGGDAQLFRGSRYIYNEDGSYSTELYVTEDNSTYVEALKGQTGKWKSADDVNKSKDSDSTIRSFGKNGIHPNPSSVFPKQKNQK